MHTWKSVAETVLDAPTTRLLPHQSARVILDGPRLDTALTCDVYYRGPGEPFRLTDPALFRSLATLIDLPAPELHHLSVSTNFALDPTTDTTSLGLPDGAIGWICGWVVIDGTLVPRPVDPDETALDIRSGDNWSPAEQGIAVVEAWQTDLS